MDTQVDESALQMRRWQTLIILRVTGVVAVLGGAATIALLVAPLIQERRIPEFGLGFELGSLACTLCVFLMYAGIRILMGQRHSKDYLLGPSALYAGSLIFLSSVVLYSWMIVEFHYWHLALHLTFPLSAAAACYTLARRRSKGLPDLSSASEPLEPE